MICLGGTLGIFATYWDDAWHTDEGRDSFWTIPHLLLYGAMALVGLATIGWGLRVSSSTRSLRRSLAETPLLAAGLGGLAALVAAPIDAAWHTAFGRDSVLWSPPHMLVVFAATALILGALTGLPQQAVALRSAAGVLLVANAIAVVFEYETDVPQFTEILYLPILLSAGLVVAGLVAGSVPLRTPVTTVVLGYAALRLGIIVALALLGHSTPDLPLAVLGLAAFDLPLRHRIRRYAAAAVTTAGLAWVASVAHLASPEAGSVGLVAAPAVVVAAAVMLLTSRRARPVAAVAMIALGVAIAVTGPARPADAHDPGQGEPVTSVRLSATSDGRGAITMTADLGTSCEHVAPTRMVARRAGSTLTGPLNRRTGCDFDGSVRVDAPGRWFVYVELTTAGRTAQAWLPVESGQAGTIRDTKDLYLPAGTQPGRKAAEVGLGVPIYALGFALLAVAACAARTDRRRRSLVSGPVAATS